MKVVITPSFPQITNSAELLHLKDILVELKENKLIPYETSISEFKLLCFERGLNEFRKDLRVLDC
tara:strand:- start:242 stop:436 length:195 start_codon:yes stop_codon:yes gene_type:complete